MTVRVSHEMFDGAISEVRAANQKFPFKHRGIMINEELIQVTMEILNDENSKALPQNCSQQVRAKSHDGLDRRIKERRDLDLRTANIISDVLQDVGIAEVYKDGNPRTGRMVKFTKLCPSWTW
jgi:hypothetical protein